MNSSKQNNIKNNPIGFCDSGVGGLTVYSKFRQKLKTENCIFYGDLKNSPYGDKTKEQLVSYSRKVFDFFKSKSVKAVIMACNTTSALTYPVLKEEYDFKIYPIIQSCAKILANMPIKRLGVFATESTINSGAYEKEIHKYNPTMTIYSQSCPEWVKIVEANSQNLKESIDTVKYDLEKMLANNPEKIVLGCTHYPYLMDILTEYTSKDIFIDPSEFFVNYILEDLKSLEILNPQEEEGSEDFYVSAKPEDFKKASKMFYKVNKVEVI